jgi:hypothetical protein
MGYAVIAVPPRTWISQYDQSPTSCAQLGCVECVVREPLLSFSTRQGWQGSLIAWLSVAWR